MRLTSPGGFAPSALGSTTLLAAPGEPMLGTKSKHPDRSCPNCATYLSTASEYSASADTTGLSDGAAHGKRASRGVAPPVAAEDLVPGIPASP